MTATACRPARRAAHDPAVRFWLRYAEGAGALWEDEGDVAVVVLPPELRHRHGLPEDLAVTADPDVARHDGALLLAPGQSVVEEAAERVLAHADVGVAALAPPPSLPPSAAALEARAREAFPVDHGRIDVVGDPAPVWAPVLRVGALVGYTVSLDQRFQEQEEVWVDATTATPVGPRPVAELARRLVAEGRPGPAVGRPRVAADVAAAVGAATAELDRRASARLGELAGQGQRARLDELARADAYYEAALGTLERRRAAAPPERARLLADRAEATRVEHTRRVAEIEEKFRPAHHVRPFRLHLVLVPALRLPVHVRRGARA
ncbi:MAG TPA: hypothetical protein VM263_04750, partial [Acidimicrobiales bacterium]|nr:hypothetical protein [Acidimicrobiales bacterium]